MLEKRTRVIIVDDSIVVCNVLKAGLARDPRLEVVGIAHDPYQARDLIVELKPDIITLDLEMPRMNGLEFISVLMENWPIPIVVISSLIDGKCETSLKALELGAVEVFPKPQSNLSSSLNKVMSNLSEIVYQSSKARISRFRQPVQSVLSHKLSTTTDKIIAIGASTGGTEAIRRVLERFPASTPGIVIVQHMPKGFTKSFADRLNQLCSQLEVREAKNGDYLRQGLALIAPGNEHMLLKISGARYYVEIKSGPPVNRHRPSVDVLFHSVAEVAGRNSIGVILTGMGNDGAKGLMSMKNVGARTLVQDEKSSVVYGMPREAMISGAAEQEATLDQIAQTVLNLV